MISLNLKNFRCWESKNFEIPDSGLVLISGKSGNGKSSILNSIFYCITGKLKNITTFNKKTTSVELIFGDIKIVRCRGPNKLIVYKGDEIYENMEAQTIIDENFGKNFSTICYIDQDNINSFIFLSPSEKMDFLESLLLDEFNIDNIKEKIKKSISTSKDEILSSNSKINVLSKVIKDMKSIDECPELTIDNINITLGNYQKIREKILKNICVSEDNLKIFQQKLKKNKDLVDIKNKNKERLKVLEEIKESLFLELSHVEGIEDTNRKIEEYETMKNIYLSNKKINSCLDNIKKLKDDYEKIAEKNNKDISMLNSELEKIPESNIDLLNKFKKIKELTDKSDDLEKDIDFDILEKSDNLIQIEEEKILENNRKINEYNELLNLKNELDKCYKCPSCQSLLSLKNKQLSIFKINDQSIVLPPYNIEDLKNIIKKSEKTIEKLKTSKIINNCKYDKYNEVNDKIEQIMVESYESKKIEMMEKDIENRHKINQKIKNIEENVIGKKILSDINMYQREVDKNKVCDETRHPKTEEEFLKLVEDLANLKNNVKYLEVLHKKIEKNDKEINEITISSIDYDSIIKDCEKKIVDWDGKVRYHNENVKKMEKWMNIMEEINKYNNIRREIEECIKNKDYYENRLKNLNKLYEQIKIAEQQSILDFIDSLNMYASIYIEYFFPDDDITVNLKTVQENKINGKEKISLNFEIIYRGITGDLSFLSGGERDRVNLAFTLALTELVDCKILMLDECISSLDIETSNKVIETLKEKYRGKLILCVAHQTVTGNFNHILNV